MSHRERQDLQPGYVDNVCVKISENYKPPPKINLAVTYSQRLSINNRIREGVTSYDFSLEQNLKEKVRELRNARKLILEEKKERLEKIKEIRRKYEEDKSKKLSESVDFTDKEKIISISNKSDVTESTTMGLTQPSQIITLPTMSSGVLYPSSYSNILTPTPLSTSVCTPQPYSCKPNDKSPFNISEFEADTSSPFDNMELKTINDIEELAQVLKKDDLNTSLNNPYAATQMYSNYAPVPNISTHSNYVSQHDGLNTTPHYASYTIPYSSASSVHSYGQLNTVTSYNNVNGYYYNTGALQSSINAQPFPYNNIQSGNSPDDSLTQSKMDKDSNFKSIPDIMKALEAELENTHIYKINHSMPVTGSNESNVTHRSSFIDNSYKQTVKCVDLENPYELLPKNLQHISNDISSMGFPLPRVARVCKIIGDDQKKIVEHLLAMSQLLDLGFSEKDVSNALLQCNNDRDKALDLLIS